MAFQIPKTSDIISGIKTRFESSLNQTVPLLDKAFVTVISTVIGMVFTSLVKFANERSRQNLALTATEEDLDGIGSNFGVDRKAGTQSKIIVDVTGTDTSIIPITSAWIGDNNGVTYYPDASYTLSGTSGQITLVSEEVGDTGNAVSGDTFTLSQPLVGIGSEATFSSQTTTGVDRESDGDYRRRILDEIRTVGGGGNSADYRRWGEEVDGVARVYPYSGRPVDGSLGVSEPGDRTVYVEADFDTFDDRVPTAQLISSVRDSLNTDPDTGLDRTPLGLTDATLFVEAITESLFYVEITGLDVSSASESEGDVQTAVETGLEQWFRDRAPFIDGLDVELDRKNLITEPAVSKVIQGILEGKGASFSSVTVYDDSDTEVSSYSLGQGELAAFNFADWL